MALTPAPFAGDHQPAGSVDLYWIPLGAGASWVRGNGIMYEAISAAIEHRPRCHLYHSALEVTLPHGRYIVEMTPVPDGDGAARGVVAEGPVGLRVAGRLRLFRYEVRRWRDGVVPDLAYAIEGAVRITDDGGVAQTVFDTLPHVPRLVWGRDEAGAGEMWSCNSIMSWTLTRAGVDISGIALPLRGRAPGWDAGAAVAGANRVHNLTAVFDRHRASDAVKPREDLSRGDGRWPPRAAGAARPALWYRGPGRSAG